MNNAALVVDVLAVGVGIAACDGAKRCGRTSDCRGVPTNIPGDRVFHRVSGPVQTSRRVLNGSQFPGFRYKFWVFRYLAEVLGDRWLFGVFGGRSGFFSVSPMARFAIMGEGGN